MKRLLVAAALCAGCSSSPADVGGDYSISGTDRTNGCNLANFMEGQTFTGVQVTITQNGSTANAAVMGAGGIALAVLLGTSSFSGNVDGDAVDLKAIGTAQKQIGNCTYTYNGEIKASLAGDALSGRIDYRAATNGNSDCMTMNIQGCDSYQDFNGTRPPK